MKRRSVVAAVGAFCAICILVSLVFLQGRTAVTTDSRYCLGTLCRITIYGNSSKAKAAIDDVWQQITRLENDISVNLSYSDVSRCNSAAGSGKGTSVSEQTYDLLKFSLEMNRLTAGALNPAMGAIVRLWAIGTPEARVPSFDETNAVLPACNPDSVNIEVRDGEYLVSLRDPQTRLDLGAVGKGYAADLAFRILKGHGIMSALIDFGGNIMVLGLKPQMAGSKEFTIGLQKPGSDRGVPFMTFGVRDLSVVTSGSYERSVSGDDGHVYSHIMDPSTGRSIETEVSSVSVIGPSSAVCDALSTALFILGPETGKGILEESFKDYCSVFMMQDGAVVRVGNVAVLE